MFPNDLEGGSKMWSIMAMLLGMAVAGPNSQINGTLDEFAVPSGTLEPELVQQIFDESMIPPPIFYKPLNGLLYPRESESREIKTLDGMWDFLPAPADDSLKGHREAWQINKLSKAGKVIQMPVPSSYNDITTSMSLRDHVGAVWYERTFFVPLAWKDKRVFLRFGSVHYLAQVWLNGNIATNHEMGHLPFEVELTGTLIFGGQNRLTVAVDNTLLQTSVPQGQVVETKTDDGKKLIQSYSFDFFNYAGIQRPVVLHTTPRVYVSDITVHTDTSGTDGIVWYDVEGAGLVTDDEPRYEVTLLDADDQPVEVVLNTTNGGKSGSMKVPMAKLWWARDMHPQPGYLYTIEVRLSVPHRYEGEDVYRMPIGIRTISWTNTSLLLNGKPVYLRGFGRHEDSVIRGRGLDLPTVARDYNLLEWVGANAYRTSHYPYSDEVMDMADRLGFMIVDECPSVDTENFSPALLEKHKQSLSELIRRDKNRPSVILWSIANEPRTQLVGAEDYFKQVAAHTKALDPSRPITIAIARSSKEDRVGQFLDVISFNRYNAWYTNAGRLDMIEDHVETEAEEWHQKYNKPVLMSEYGADTMPGLHELPEYVWSEDFQVRFLSRHFEAFDRLRRKGFFIGEFIWNFADFRTAQTYTRVGGNKKGIFTRDRQPKAAAHVVRRRYNSLAEELDGVPLPESLQLYIAPNYKERTEL